jgi:hypothetical protein
LLDSLSLSAPYFKVTNTSDALTFSLCPYLIDL